MQHRIPPIAWLGSCSALRGNDGDPAMVGTRIRRGGAVALSSRLWRLRDADTVM